MEKESVIIYLASLVLVFLFIHIYFFYGGIDVSRIYLAPEFPSDIFYNYSGEYLIDGDGDSVYDSIAFNLSVSLEGDSDYKVAAIFKETGPVGGGGGNVVVDIDESFEFMTGHNLSFSSNGVESVNAILDSNIFATYVLEDEVISTFFYEGDELYSLSLVINESDLHPPVGQQETVNFSYGVFQGGKRVPAYYLSGDSWGELVSNQENNITMIIRWQDLMENKITGPLTLEKIYLFNESADWPVAVESDVYGFSGSYDYHTFESGDETYILFSDWGEDVDGDEKFDYLTINMTNLSEGDYNLEMLLDDMHGNQYGNVEKEFSSTGKSDIIPIRFNGLKINYTGVVSPTAYNITDLWLEKVEMAPVEEYYSGVGLTSNSYSSTQFDGPGWKKISPAYNWTGVDVNSNGLFDYLSFNFRINVSTAGYYSFFTAINDIVPSYPPVPANVIYYDVGVHQLNVLIGGYNIYLSGILYSEQDNFLSLSVYEMGYWKGLGAKMRVNLNYLSYENESGLEVAGSFSDEGNDDNADCSYESLEIVVPVNITRAGNFTFDASLKTNEVPVGVVESRSVSDLGLGVRDIVLSFNGSEIYNIGYDGNYSVHLRILRDGMEIYGNAGSEYLTHFYNHTNFSESGSCPSSQQCDNDGICESGENADDCPNDCDCGDGTCDSSETCSNCPADCGDCPADDNPGDSGDSGDDSSNNVPPTCGNGFCSSSESCSNCPADCGVCGTGGTCGDGTCDSSETCSNCPADCGECVNVTSINNETETPGSDFGSYFSALKGGETKAVVILAIVIICVAFITVFLFVVLRRQHYEKKAFKKFKGK